MTAKIPFSKRYAHGATTKPETTRAEIETTLKRFGATGFAFASQGQRASLMFEAHGRRIRFDLPDAKTSLVPYDRYPSTVQVDAEERRLWRSLLMAIKSKLEVVQSGISSFEFEFLPYTVLPTGQTFAEASEAPSFQDALSAGQLPPMLTGAAR
jgi:hypothetical protein